MWRCAPGRWQASGGVQGLLLRVGRQAGRPGSGGPVSIGSWQGARGVAAVPNRRGMQPPGECGRGQREPAGGGSRRQGREARGAGTSKPQPAEAALLTLPLQSPLRPANHPAQQVNDISLEDYLAVKPKFARFTAHSAGRFQKRRFRKAQCPIVERWATGSAGRGRVARRAGGRAGQRAAGEGGWGAGGR